MRVSNKLSYFFNSTIGVKQGCPHSPTLRGLCIDELGEMVAKFVKEEGVEEGVLTCPDYCSESGYCPEPIRLLL